MSYNIETRSITEFVTDSKIKLPRFQRKSTWTANRILSWLLVSSKNIQLVL